MQDRKSQKNFERALLHEMEKIKIAARQWHNNNTRGYRDFRSKEAISKSFSEIAVLCMGCEMCVAVVTHTMLNHKTSEL